MHTDLPLPVAPGDQQVGHASEIADHGMAADVGPERDAQLVAPVGERG